MKILQPVTLRDVTFKNRVMFPPLTTGYEAGDGSISVQSRAFYTRLAHEIPNRVFIACVLNAENGFELMRSMTPATVKKNAVLIGGGPAGREAARVAAQKGHSVTLFEKSTARRG